MPQESTSTCGGRLAYNRHHLQDTPLLKSLTRISPSLTAAGNFALSGAAFAIGNLLLARQMRTDAYASLSLCTAVFVVGSQVATFGYSQIAQRQALPDGLALLMRLLLQGLALGVIAAAVVHWNYGLDTPTSLWLILVITAGTIIWVVAAILLREGRRGWAYLFQTLPDWVFLVLGLVALAAPRWASVAAFPTYCTAAGVIAVAAWVLQPLLTSAPAEQPRRVPWPLLLSSTGIVAGGILLSQIERLAVGFLLEPRDMAMVGVLASIAVFAFRLVNTAAGFVLTPSLRRITDTPGRLQLVRRELRVIGGALLVATLGICVLGSQVAHWITAGRYEPGVLLLLAACLAGAAKVLHGVPRAIIVACGTDDELARFSRYTWLGVAMGALGAIAGAFAGLMGVLLGIAAGSILGAMPGAQLARHVLYTGEPRSKEPPPGRPG